MADQLEKSGGVISAYFSTECGSLAFQRFHNHARMTPNASSPANANAATTIWSAGIGAADRY
jgi:hypothetical protein